MFCECIIYLFVDWVFTIVFGRNVCFIIFVCKIAFVWSCQEMGFTWFDSNFWYIPLYISTCELIILNWLLLIKRIQNSTLDNFRGIKRLIFILYWSIIFSIIILWRQRRLRCQIKSDQLSLLIYGAFKFIFRIFGHIKI